MRSDRAELRAKADEFLKSVQDYVDLLVRTGDATNLTRYIEYNKRFASRELLTTMRDLTKG